MSLEPSDWNVVVVGRWNSSILTPVRITNRIYKIEVPEKGEIPVEVMVPLDGISPYKVLHPENRVETFLDINRLVVNTLVPNYENLQCAMGCCINAIEWLPETPVTAVGINIRYKISGSNDELNSLLEARSFDDPIVLKSYNITKRAILRRLELHEGMINITISSNDDEFIIHFNFHRGSDDNNELINWLKMSSSEIRDHVDTILTELHLDAEEQLDDRH